MQFQRTVKIRVIASGLQTGLYRATFHNSETQQTTYVGPINRESMHSILETVKQGCARNRSEMVFDNVTPVEFLPTNPLVRFVH
jgi:hypothetical protein